MTQMPVAARLARARNLHFVAQPKLWPVWPFLPLVRRRDGPTDYGLLYDARGFAATITVAEGITVTELFAERMPGCKAADFLIRVNRLPASADQALKEGDRVSMTPLKIEGAAA